MNLVGQNCPYITEFFFKKSPFIHSCTFCLQSPCLSTTAKARQNETMYHISGQQQRGGASCKSPTLAPRGFPCPRRRRQPGRGRLVEEHLAGELAALDGVAVARQGPLQGGPERSLFPGGGGMSAKPDLKTQNMQ